MAKIQTQWEMCGSNFTADWKNIPHKHSTPAVCNMNNLSFLTLKTNIRKQHYFSLTRCTYVHKPCNKVQPQVCTRTVQKSYDSKVKENRKKLVQ